MHTSHPAKTIAITAGTNAASVHSIGEGWDRGPGSSCGPPLASCGGPTGGDARDSGGRALAPPTAWSYSQTGCNVDDKGFFTSQAGDPSGHLQGFARLCTRQRKDSNTAEGSTTGAVVETRGTGQPIRRFCRPAALLGWTPRCSVTSPRATASKAHCISLWGPLTTTRKRRPDAEGHGQGHCPILT